MKRKLDWVEYVVWAVLGICLPAVFVIGIYAYQTRQEIIAECRARGMDSYSVYKTGTLCVDKDNRLVVP